MSEEKEKLKEMSEETEKLLKQIQMLEFQRNF